MKIRAYVDTGGWHPDLENYRNVVDFLYFPYENKNKNCVPSEKASYKDWSEVDIPWDRLCAKFDETSPSERRDAIEKILGSSYKHRKDVLHLDTACRNGCSYFLTSDNKDIVRNEEVLGNLLNLKIFNTQKELLLVKKEFDDLR